MGKKSGPGPLVCAPNSSRKFCTLSESRKSDKRPRPGGIHLREFLWVGFHDDERTAHHRVALDQNFHSTRRHLAHLRRNVTDDDVGVVAARELQNVTFGNRVVSDDPIALWLDARQPPQGVHEFAAADALKINEARLGSRRFCGARRRRSSCRECAPDRPAGRRCTIHCASTGAC